MSLKKIEEEYYKFLKDLEIADAVINRDGVIGNWWLKKIKKLFETEEVIAEEELNFLKDLSREMNSQDKRMTHYVMFMVYDEVKVYCGDDWGDERERREDSYEDCFGNNLLCENCLKLLGDGEELPDDCNDCDSECFVSYKWELQPQDEAGVFFTAKACDEYIQSRRYAFNKPVSYGISMYRSDEMKRVMDIISKLTLKEGDKNPLR